MSTLHKLFEAYKDTRRIDKIKRDYMALHDEFKHMGRSFAFDIAPKLLELGHDVMDIVKARKELLKEKLIEDLAAGPGKYDYEVAVKLDRKGKKITGKVSWK